MANSNLKVVHRQNYSSIKDKQKKGKRKREKEKKMKLMIIASVRHLTSTRHSQAQASCFIALISVDKEKGAKLVSDHDATYVIRISFSTCFYNKPKQKKFWTSYYALADNNNPNEIYMKN